MFRIFFESQFSYVWDLSLSYHVFAKSLPIIAYETLRRIGKYKRLKILYDNLSFMVWWAWLNERSVRPSNFIDKEYHNSTKQQKESDKTMEYSKNVVSFGAY